MTNRVEARTHTHTHTHTCLMALYPGLPGWVGTRKVKPIWILLKQDTHTHTHPFNGHFSGTTQVSRYQKGKTNLDFTEARDSEWQWHQLGHMQVCSSLQTDNHASISPLEALNKKPVGLKGSFAYTRNRTHFWHTASVAQSCATYCEILLLLQ